MRCTAIVEDDAVADAAMKEEMLQAVGFTSIDSTSAVEFATATGCDMQYYGFPFDLDDEGVFVEWLQHCNKNCAGKPEHIAQWLKIARKYRATAIIE